MGTFYARLTLNLKRKIKNLEIICRISPQKYVGGQEKIFIEYLPCVKFLT